MGELKVNFGRGKMKNKPASNFGERSRSINRIMSFEERMSSIALPEFRIVENDFPSLLNCDESETAPKKLNENNINDAPQTLPVSYSAKLLSKNEETPASSDLAAASIKTQIENNVNEIDSAVEPVLIKKKRKRRKKKSKSALLGDTLGGSGNFGSDTQIDLKDPEEYPVLGTSSTLKAKTNENTLPPKTSVSLEVEKAAVPGLLKVNTNSTKTSAKSTRKKANMPVQINIFDVLTKPRKQAEVKAKKTTSPATFNVRKAKVNINPKSAPHNVLDSSAPLRKRGKEREKPKTKVTKLKKVILQERLLKKQRQAIMTPVNTEIVLEVAENLQNLEIMTREDIQVNESKIDDEIVLDNGQISLDVQTSSNGDSSENKCNDDKIFAIPEFPAKTDDFHETMACVKKIIHTRKYRDYCDQQLSREIDSTLECLLMDLVRFQDRQFQKDPIKAKVRKRMVFGLKEVVKNIKLSKVKVVIIAPDIEQITSEGGLNDTICNLIKLCQDNKILVVFGLPRRKLGYVCKKAVPVSCIGIINFEGKEDLFKKLVEFVTEARASYQFIFAQIEKQLNKEMKTFILNADLNNKQLQEMKKNILLSASQAC